MHGDTAREGVEALDQLPELPVLLLLPASSLSSGSSSSAARASRARMCGKDLATRSISAGSMDRAAPTSRMAWRTRYVSGMATVATRSVPNRPMIAR